MKVILFGATGMVGQGVLRECLLDPDVDLVETIGRSATGATNPKVKEVVHADLFHYADIEERLRGFDACFFCLGVSAAGIPEAEYERLTYQLTIAAARALCVLNPQMTFVYVSGTGTDSTEKGSIAWARVKGKTENELLRMPFKAAYMFRPGVIQPMNGEVSKTKLYRVLYSVTKPLLPLLQRLAPNYFLTTEQIGRAMINVVRKGAPKRVLEISDIRDAARS
jgi:uncharacterized protein YbjT (DUF2867 family)